MVRDRSSLAVIALASAGLAYIVAPSGLGAAAKEAGSGGPVVATTIETPRQMTLTATGSASGNKGAAEPSAPVLIRHAARIAPKDTKRVKVPVGCERVISGLVRSAMASQIARCVT
ncbi:hypothetical protein [uncultured Enterovirga sp.]|uniref:hypothetical protein n=1 Tax=uncultured Enterovirga sp. TaxID=2026352 RepID=UPI0035CBBBC7